MMSKIGNCQRCVDMGKEMGFKLTGIEGKDIYDEHSTFVLALLSQMMRAYTTKVSENTPIFSPIPMSWINVVLGSSRSGRRKARNWQWHIEVGKRQASKRASNFVFQGPKDLYFTSNLQADKRYCARHNRFFCRQHFSSRYNEGQLEKRRSF